MEGRGGVAGPERGKDAEGRGRAEESGRSSRSRPMARREGVGAGGLRLHLRAAAGSLADGVPLPQRSKADGAEADPSALKGRRAKMASSRCQRRCRSRPVSGGARGAAPGGGSGAEQRADGGGACAAWE